VLSASGRSPVEFAVTILVGDLGDQLLQRIDLGEWFHDQLVTTHFQFNPNILSPAKF